MKPALLTALIGAVLLGSIAAASLGRDTQQFTKPSKKEIDSLLPKRRIARKSPKSEPMAAKEVQQFTKPTQSAAVTAVLDAKKKAEEEADKAAIAKLPAALKKAKCPTTRRPVSEEMSSDYQEFKIYFYDESAMRHFSVGRLKLEAYAFHQAAVTKQAVQVRCPITGEKFFRKNAVEIDGITVYFSRPDVAEKVRDMAVSAQIAACFSHKPFGIAFLSKKVKL